MEGQEQKTIRWIDGLKGFAMLLVILGHCLGGYLDARLFPAYRNEMLLVFEGIYSFHMPLFFMLSGYVFQVSYQGASAKKVRRKMMNIGALYFIFSILQICVQIGLKGYVNQQMSVENIWMLPALTVL